MSDTAPDHESATFAQWVAPPAWRTVDLISDLHLQAQEADTVQAWRSYLQTTPADALFILGDLFEVWVGDDAAEAPGFEQLAVQALHAAAQRLPIHFLHGNRDFLVGEAFARATGVHLLADPTVLAFQGRHWLLSHGDLLCLDDTEYLAFRAQVRSPAWQAAFLARPLVERQAFARGARTQSEARKSDPDMVWADVDAAAARRWLQRAGADTLIHGHTHRPAEHALGDGLRRIVLSDWDAEAQPPRLQVLRLSAAGAQRVDLG
jgi:UDP-2,3-diacylglucosamine hydrolase